MPRAHALEQALATGGPPHTEPAPQHPHAEPRSSARRAAVGSETMYFVYAAGTTASARYLQKWAPRRDLRPHWMWKGAETGWTVGEHAINSGVNTYAAHERRRSAVHMLICVCCVCCVFCCCFCCVCCVFCYFSKRCNFSLRRSSVYFFLYRWFW